VSATIGRRERKKRAVRAALLDAATAMFVEKGFEATRIEAIAGVADVAVGTVYNHFATKNDLLLAVLLADVDDVIERAREPLARPHPETALAVLSVARLVVAAMDRRPRELWRNVIGNALLDPPGLGAAYWAVNRRLFAVLAELLERHRAQGHLAAHWSVESAAEVAFALADSLVYRYVQDDAWSPQEYEMALERNLRAVFG
jgi:AcrR family transcriptional regulator